MNKVWRRLLAGLLLMPAAAHAQTIRGVVVEDDTRTPIAGVLVELLGPDARLVTSAQTDSAGEFLLLPRRIGGFTMRLRHLAYAPVDSDTVSLRPGESIEIELGMGRTAIPLAPVVVTTRSRDRLGGFYERQERGGFGRFLTREEIERRPGPWSSELLRGMPGVHLVPVTIGLGASIGNLITMRGGTGRCLPTIYVDGMEVKQFADSSIDDFLRPNMLEGVEVYTSGGAPGHMYSRDGCGVVAFWTRTDNLGRWSWRKLVAGLGLFSLLVLLAR